MATTGYHESSLSSNNWPRTKIANSRAPKLFGITPNTGPEEPLLQIATNKGETTVIEDAPGAENNQRTALVLKLNLVTGNKSFITPQGGIWLIDKHSPPRALCALMGRASKSAISRLEVL